MSVKFNPWCVVLAAAGKKRHTVRAKNRAAAGENAVSESPNSNDYETDSESLHLKHHQPAIIAKEQTRREFLA